MTPNQFHAALFKSNKKLNKKTAEQVLSYIINNCTSETARKNAAKHGNDVPIIYEEKFPSSVNNKEMKELVKNVSAFANTDGGYIFYGISDHPKNSKKLDPGVKVDKKELELIKRTINEKTLKPLKIGKKNPDFYFIPVNLNKKDYVILRVKKVTGICVSLYEDKKKNKKNKDIKTEYKAYVRSKNSSIEKKYKIVKA